MDKEFRYDAGIYKTSETHAGEDVAVYARGPMAHMFHGKERRTPTYHMSNLFLLFMHRCTSSGTVNNTRADHSANDHNGCC